MCCDILLTASRFSRSSLTPGRHRAADKAALGRPGTARKQLTQRAMVNFEDQKSVRKVFVKHQLILGISGTYLV